MRSRPLAALPGKAQVWAVGESRSCLLADAHPLHDGTFAVLNSAASTPLVGQIQRLKVKHTGPRVIMRVYVFHNRPQFGSLYEPVSQRCR